MRVISIALVIISLFCAMPAFWGCSQDHNPAASSSDDLRSRPWTLEYRKHPNISDYDARRAQMIAGLAKLEECADIAVTVPDDGYGDGELALVMAVGVDGNRGLWYVDLDSEVLLGEFVILSSDPETMEVVDVRSGAKITAQMMEEAVVSESHYDQLAQCAEILGIVTGPDEELESIWRKIKDKWNSMNPCEQAHLIAGVIGCGGVGLVGGPGVGIACGIGVWISSAINC